MLDTLKILVFSAAIVFVFVSCCVRLFESLMSEISDEETNNEIYGYLGDEEEIDDTIEWDI